MCPERRIFANRFRIEHQHRRLAFGETYNKYQQLIQLFPRACKNGGLNTCLEVRLFADALRVPPYGLASSAFHHTPNTTCSIRTTAAP